MGIQNTLLCISFLYIGVNNDIFSSYFNLPFAVVDWFTIITRPAAWLTCVGFAFLSILNKASFRKVALTCASLSVIASLCQLVAYGFPFLYWFMFIGNFLLGILVGYIMVIPVSFAVLWFPDNEIGTAMSIRMVCSKLGFLLAFLVPSHFLTPTQCESNGFNTSAKNFTECECNWVDEEKQKMLIYVGVILVISVLILIFLIFFAIDQPPKPPTVAQALLRQNIETQKEEQFGNKIVMFFKETKKLFTDGAFLILILLLATVYVFNYYQALFLSEILRPIFQSFYSSVDADRMSSYLVVAFELAAIIGTFITGFLVDRIKNYVLLIRIHFAWCVICWIGLIVGYCFQNITAVFVCNFLSGLGCGSLYVPIFDLSTQHTYPRKPDFVGSCLRWGYNIIFLIVIEGNRLVIYTTGGLGSLIYLAMILSSSLLLTIILKPKYRRLEAEKQAVENFSETQPFLSNRNNSE